ncbi:MAG: hypothetical protein H7Z19_14980, partial [Chitinophagaceae bacterium]|nr:hypothetical protein [Rubrivivax sp.]
LGQLDAAHKLVPRAWAACQQFGAPVVAPTVALLAALRGDFETAARLIGHARAAYAAHEMGIGVNDENMFEQVQTLAGGALNAAALERLVEQGSTLDDAAALALAARSGSQV